MKHFLGMSYERTRKIAPGISLTFYDAGHILGSAMVALDIEDREQKRDIRLVFSGDIGRNPVAPSLETPPQLKKPTFCSLNRRMAIVNMKSMLSATKSSARSSTVPSSVGAK